MVRGRKARGSGDAVGWVENNLSEDLNFQEGRKKGGCLIVPFLLELQKTVTGKVVGESYPSVHSSAGGCELWGQGPQGQPPKASHQQGMSRIKTPGRP